MSLDLRLPHAIASHQQYPYEPSSISSSASSSTSSVFSIDALSSQSSTGSGPSQWDCEDSRGRDFTSSLANYKIQPLVQPAPVEPPCTVRRVLPVLQEDLCVPAELRQNPRRSSSANQRPPPLVRQTERKCQFVDGLVDSATQMVEVIWPLSVPACRSEGGRGVLPLRTFIQETLRRSRTSFSTLQVALYYLILIKPHVPKYDFTMEQPEDMQSLRALQCGRRMFLAALILASKYLQDRNYSARAWSKISGLKVCEINLNEMAFLEAVNWKLHIAEEIFDRWHYIIFSCTSASRQPPPGASPTCIINEWKALVKRLSPGLETVVVPPRTPGPFIDDNDRFSSPMPSPLPRAGFGSQDSTPTPATVSKLPRFLEPKPDMLPPTPSLARLGPLPTPQMTPQPPVSCTPAASAVAFGSRRPSMCAAMAQVQNSCMTRSTMDQWSGVPRSTGLEAYQIISRRPSHASTTSLSSSPESMVSDNSSRSSRSSSISSASSGCSGIPSSQPRVSRIAMLRCARLPYPVQTKEVEPVVNDAPVSSPDFSSFTINDPEAGPLHVSAGPCSRRYEALKESKQSKESSKSKSRKRGRSSVDLQKNVRNLLNPSPSSSCCVRTGEEIRANKLDVVLPDRSVAQSFMLPSSSPLSGISSLSPGSSPSGAKASQSPSLSLAERRLPVQKDLGRKRACCASEVAKPASGPGMWRGILWD